MNVELIDIKTIATEGKGALSFFEANKDIPFKIRRIYYICDVPKGEKRGFHAHWNLSQFLFCPYGAVTITLDDGAVRRNFLLDNPSKGLLVEGLVWREMCWRQSGSVLAVAASEYYDESDYIRDYGAFLKALGKGNC